MHAFQILECTDLCIEPRSHQFCGNIGMIGEFVNGYGIPHIEFNPEGTKSHFRESFIHQSI